MSTLDDLSDEELATKVRMLTRDDLLHEPIVCAARDRILTLSRQLSAVKEMAFKTRDGVPIRKGMILYWRTETGGAAPAPGPRIACGIFNGENLYSCMEAARATDESKE